VQRADGERTTSTAAPAPTRGGSSGRLDAAQLRHVRQMAFEELYLSHRDGAEREHLDKVARLVGEIDARLERRDG
jgi:hypothetical protein